MLLLILHDSSGIRLCFIVSPHQFAGFPTVVLRIAKRCIINVNTTLHTHALTLRSDMRSRHVINALRDMYEETKDIERKKVVVEVMRTNAIEDFLRGLPS